MKKAFAAALTLLFTVLFCLNASATTETPDGYSEFFSSLPEGLSESLPSDGFGTDAQHDAAELTTWDFLLSSFGNAVGKQFSKLVPMLAAIIGLLLISAIIGAVSVSLEPKTAKVLTLCSNCAVAAACIGLQYGTLTAAADYLSDLTVLVGGMTPVVITLYVTGGNVASAGVGATALSVFLGFSEKFLAGSVVPFTGCCLALAAVSAAAPQLGIGGLLKLIKRWYTTVLTFIMVLLCAILGAQHTIASGTDSISMRVARFAAGSAIPIVGGSVSESLKTLATSVGVLRKCFGVTGIILVALLTLPILLLLLLTRMCLNLAASFAELLGCDSESRLLGEISGIYGCLAAVVCSCSVMFIFLLSLLANCVAVFG